MPIPSASPPNDMMLRLMPSTFSGANVTSSEIGILTATMAVRAQVLRRNRNSTRMASSPPKIAVLRTSSMLLSMNSERSATSASSAPSLL